MSNLLLPIWLQSRAIDEHDHEELIHLADGMAPFFFKDVTKDSISKFYHKYSRLSFFRLLRVLGFYGVRFTGKMAAYSGPQEKYPEVISIDRVHWEEKIILPEALSIFALSLRSFGLTNFKQLHGVPIQSLIALSGNYLFCKEITTAFQATIIQVSNDFFTPLVNSISYVISNAITNDENDRQLDSLSYDRHNTASITDDEEIDPQLSQTLESLELTSELLNILHDYNIRYLGELVAKNDGELLAILNGSRKFLQKIKVFLFLAGLCTDLKVRTINQDYDSSVENEDSSLSVEILDLSVRSTNCLRQANIKTISELLSKKDKDLLSIQYFGKKCLNEIRSKLQKYQPPKKQNKLQRFSIDKTDWLNKKSNQDEIFSALKTRVSDLVLSVRSKNCLKKLNIRYIWQLVQLSEIDLLKSRNLGRNSINELAETLENFGFYFGMRFTSDQLVSIQWFEPTTENLVLDASIKQAVLKLSSLPLSFLDDRENFIIEERLFKTGKKKTLEDVAIQFALSRERIRQLEKSATNKIKQHHQTEFRIIADELKKRVGQPTDLAVLEELGIEQSEFSAKEQTIASCLLRMMDEKVFVDWNLGLVSTRGEEWIISICDLIELQINKAVPSKFFTENNLAESIKKVCVSLGISSDLCQKKLTKKFCQVKKVRFLDNFLCCGRVTKQDHIVLAFKELFPDGLEIYKEQNQLIEKLKANDAEWFGDTSPRAIFARLTDHPDIFLWRRGFFIHKDHVQYDEAIVEKVATWIEQRFDQGHSRFQVEIPCNVFREILLQGGIPNQYALYTLLRLQNNTRIGQRKFPTIVDLQADVDIQEGILEELERYFLQAGGPISYSQLKDEFIVKRGWKVYSVQQNIAAHSEVIYPWHDGSYNHLEHMAVNYTKLEDLLDAVRTKLNTIQGAYSLKGARKEMNVLWEQACPSASIRTMIKLIRLMDPEDLQIERYFIQYADQMTESVSATLELEEFCLEKGMEVNSHELHEEFCKQRGWSESQYYPVIRKANLFRSGKSTYLHPATINWDESLSQSVHQIMESYLDARNKNNYPHMQIEELIYQYALPELPQDIQWTHYLLKSIGKEFGDFLFFDDAYIAIDNDFDIEDLDDMIGFLIGRHFRMGITKRTAVEQLLWREGILESGKSIPADQYFNESSIVFLPASDEVGLSPTGIERYAQSI